MEADKRKLQTTLDNAEIYTLLLVWQPQKLKALYGYSGIANAW